MKLQNLILALILGLTMIANTSCTVNSRSIKEPLNYVEFDRDDFLFSEPKFAKATSTKIFGIDFARLFKKDVGMIEGKVTIPVIGQYLGDQTTSYALYNLLDENQDYDIIMYPKIQKQTTGIPFIFTTTKVKVTARLAKIE